MGNHWYRQKVLNLGLTLQRFSFSISGQVLFIFEGSDWPHGGIALQYSPGRRD